MEEAADALEAPETPEAVKAAAVNVEAVEVEVEVEVEAGVAEECRVCESSALLRAVATARATADATAETMRALCVSVPLPATTDCSKVSRTNFCTSSICDRDNLRTGGSLYLVALVVVASVSLVAMVVAMVVVLVVVFSSVEVVEVLGVEEGASAGPVETNLRRALILWCQFGSICRNGC